MNEVNITAKQKIKNALITLMQKQSFDSITITDLTNEAKVNRSSYYYHYYHKEEVINDIMEQCSYKLVQVIKSSYTNKVDLNINQEILPSSTNLFKHVYVHRDYYNVLLNSEKSLSFQNEFIDVIIHYFLNNTNPIYSTEPANKLIERETFSNFMAHGLLGMIKKWDSEGYKTTPMDMAKQLTYFLFYKMDKVNIKLH